VTVHVPSSFGTSALQHLPTSGLISNSLTSRNFNRSPELYIVQLYRHRHIVSEDCGQQSVGLLLPTMAEPEYLYQQYLLENKFCDSCRQIPWRKLFEKLYHNTQADPSRKHECRHNSRFNPAGRRRHVRSSCNLCEEMWFTPQISYRYWDSSQSLILEIRLETGKYFFAQ